jgi:hypothetical protein
MEQAADTGVGRTRSLQHLGDDRRELEQSKLVGNAEGPVLRHAAATRASAVRRCES